MLSDAILKSKTYRGLRLPLPAAYQTVIGSIIAHWGLLETELWHTLEGLRKSKKVRALRETIPPSFEQRMDLLKDSIRLSYEDCPTYAEKLCELVSEAKHLANDRDLIVHGRWGVSGEKVSAYSIGRKGTRRKDYTIAKLKLERDKIANLHWRYLIHVWCLIWPHRAVVEKFLTSDEISALQARAYHNRPPLPKPQLT